MRFSLVRLYNLNIIWFIMIKNRAWDYTAFILLELSVNRYKETWFIPTEWIIETSWETVVGYSTGMNETSPQAKCVNSSQNHYF